MNDHLATTKGHPHGERHRPSAARGHRPPPRTPHRHQDGDPTPPRLGIPPRALPLGTDLRASSARLSKNEASALIDRLAHPPVIHMDHRPADYTLSAYGAAAQRSLEAVAREVGFDGPSDNEVGGVHTGDCWGVHEKDVEISSIALRHGALVVDAD